METQTLRQKILSLAVRGALLPQKSEDEPASALLARIRKEKEETAAKGNTRKKRQTLSAIHRGEDGRFYETDADQETDITDDLPFDIPDSWEWVRLGELFEINPRNQIEDEKEVGFLPMALLEGGFENEHSFEVRKWKAVKKGFTHFANGDIVIAKITPCFQNQKSAIIKNLPNGFGAGTTELHVLRDPFHFLNTEYFFWLCKSSRFIEDGKKNFSGTAGQQRVGKDFIQDYLVPLPPLAEQHRIAETVETLFASLDQWDDAARDLRESAQNLAAKALSLAIRGALLPQEETDEPASVLLARIRKEKQRLIKEGKRKQGKNPSEITRGPDGRFCEKKSGQQTDITDTLPFDIPDTWEWVRLGELVTIIAGTSYKKHDVMTEGIRILRGGNIQNNEVTFYDDDVFLSESYKDVSKNIYKGDTIIVASTGSKAVIGKPAFIEKEYPLTQIGAFLRIIRPIDFGLADYVSIIFQSEYYRKHIRDSAKGTNINNIKAEYIEDFLIPIPPLAEQHRIVHRLDQILSLLASLHFPIEMPHCNESTVTAMKEAKRISRDPTVRGYESMDDLKKALNE